MTPKEARLRFKLRSVENWALVIVVFGVVAFFAARSESSWLIDALASLVLVLLFFFILDKRAVGLNCPSCGKYIASNTPWICGCCHKRNERVDEYSFLGRCEHCKTEPKAYQCHHSVCRKLIFLTKDELEEGYARCITAPRQDEYMQSNLAREEAKRAKQHEIDMAKMKTDLAEHKRRLALHKKKNVLQGKKKQLDEGYGAFLGFEAYVEQLRAEANKKYKNDEHMRKRANDFFDGQLADNT